MAKPVDTKPVFEMHAMYACPWGAVRPLSKNVTIESVEVQAPTGEVFSVPVNTVLVDVSAAVASQTRRFIFEAEMLFPEASKRGSSSFSTAPFRETLPTPEELMRATEAAYRRVLNDRTQAPRVASQGDIMVVGSAKGMHREHRGMAILGHDVNMLVVATPKKREGADATGVDFHLVSADTLQKLPKLERGASTQFGQLVALGR